MIKIEGVDSVTDADFEERVLRSGGLPVLVEFTADWCPPCRQIAPVLSAVAAEERDRIRIVQLDVDTNPATTARYGVLSMPTLMVFRAGEPVKSMVGARAKRTLLRELADVLEGGPEGGPR
ncbi:thioredoxin family protein [Streptomyces paludis]|uniref:Thioredoxin n=1 Tax=Streptomyces paludis TaxID=2282738 RepID=A0A345HUK9_9ACTN|nr:thioredoxin domain-containing protein [Streptomyces paludis]AXG80383.1 thiol reductase thioredoxin [Streptomyces paludis]